MAEGRRKVDAEIKDFCQTGQAETKREATESVFAAFLAANPEINQLAFQNLQNATELQKIASLLREPGKTDRKSVV